MESESQVDHQNKWADIFSKHCCAINIPKLWLPRTCFQMFYIICMRKTLVAANIQLFSLYKSFSKSHLFQGPGVCWEEWKRVMEARIRNWLGTVIRNKSFSIKKVVSNKSQQSHDPIIPHEKKNNHSNKLFSIKWK